MILSLCSVKILTEFDDIVAGAYVKLLVKSTDDGLPLLKFQGFEYKSSSSEEKGIPTPDGQQYMVKPKCEFWQHNNAICQNDLTAVSYWCLILLYLIVARELFNWLSLLYPASFYNINGYTWDLELNPEKYNNSFMVQW